MPSVWSLMAMILWGVLLGVGYQVFCRWLDRCGHWFYRLLLYSGGALVCFLATAFFIYFVSGGKWGFYGFLAMILGFFCHRKWFWALGLKFSEILDGILAFLGRLLGTVGEKTAGVVLFPFDRFVDKGEKWIIEKEEKRRKKREAAETSASQ